MSPVLRLMAVFSVVLVIFDTVAALVASRTEVGYDYFGIGWFTLYALCGFLIGMIAGPAMAASGTGIVAAVEGTVGWAIAWHIGPGKLPEDKRKPRNVIRGVTINILAASVLALVTGFIGALGA